MIRKKLEPKEDQQPKPKITTQPTAPPTPKPTNTSEPKPQKPKLKETGAIPKIRKLKKNWKKEENSDMLDMRLYFKRVVTKNLPPSDLEREQVRNSKNILFLKSPLKTEAVEHQNCPTDR